MCLSKVVNIVITHPKLFAPRALRDKATHSERLHVRSCGSPLQGFEIVGTDEPRVWSPLQGYAPWALERVAPLGLAPPPGNWPRSTTYKIVIPHPALDKDKRATLWVAPLGLRDCGRGRTPTAAQAPIGATPPQSPGCVALQGRPNPGLVSPPGKEALQGRRNPQPRRKHQRPRKPL